MEPSTSDSSAVWPSVATSPGLLDTVCSSRNAALPSLTKLAPQRSLNRGGVAV